MEIRRQDCIGRHRRLTERAGPVVANRVMRCLRACWNSARIFYTLTEAKVLIERWRHEYNTVRPHSSLGYRAQAPAAIGPIEPGSAALRPPQWAREQVQAVT